MNDSNSSEEPGAVTFTDQKEHGSGQGLMWVEWELCRMGTVSIWEDGENSGDGLR